MSKAKLAKIFTVVVLERATMCETFVGLIEGKVPMKERRRIARDFKLSDREEEEDIISFREMKASSVTSFSVAININGKIGKDSLGWKDALEPKERLVSDVHDS